jgi:prevent-host-death family protein
MIETAGVAQLKASLSKYLDLVKSGDELLITERGKPIARILPIDQRDIDSLPPHMQEMVRTGRLRLPRETGPLPESHWKNMPKLPPGVSAVAAILAEREESPY